MNCPQVQEQLVDFLYQELDPEAEARVQAHVEGCDPCSRELHHLEGTLSLTRGVTVPPLPEAVREALWARIEAREESATEAVWSLFSPAVLGALTCLLSLYPLVHFGVAERIQPKLLVLGAVLWASIYNTVFASIFHHARLKRLLAPQALPGRGDPGGVEEPEEAQGVRIQVVVYGLLCAFTGTFWGTLLWIGPGATRSPFIETPSAMAGVALAVLTLVGFGIGVYERRHIFTSVALVSAIFCALGTPALFMICHGALEPTSVLSGTIGILVCSLLGGGLGQAVRDLSPSPTSAVAGSVRSSG